MSSGKWFVSAALLFTTGSMLLGADEPKSIPTPATQPSEAKPTRTRKLTEPWSMLKTLTPEQTTQIEKIHADAVEQTKKVVAKEHDDITAILTPDQLNELKVAEGKHAMELKERGASRKKGTATTEPMK